jgi:hypothetical protein
LGLRSVKLIGLLAASFSPPAPVLATLAWGQACDQHDWRDLLLAREPFYATVLS